MLGQKRRVFGIDIEGCPLSASNLMVRVLLQQVIFILEIQLQMVFNVIPKNRVFGPVDDVRCRKGYLLRCGPPLTRGQNWRRRSARARLRNTHSRDMPSSLNRLKMHYIIEMVIAEGQ